MHTLTKKSSLANQAWVRLAGIILLLISAPAFGALGGSLGSVLDDQQHMDATLEVKDAGSYTIHAMRLPTGTIVREYVTPAGRVFGIAWEGPFLPNMPLLLGDYFAQYSSAAKAQRESHVGRRPLNIQEPGLVVQTAGHMRAYSGRAYDPSLLPEGVSANVVR